MDAPSDVRLANEKRQAEKRRQNWFTIAGCLFFGGALLAFILFLLSPPEKEPQRKKCEKEDDCPLLMICKNGRCDVKDDGCDGGCPAGYSCEKKSGGGVKCEPVDSSATENAIRIFIVVGLLVLGVATVVLFFSSKRSRDLEAERENKELGERVRSLEIKDRNSLERRVAQLEERGKP